MECACGCGGAPVKGHFLPGHDQRLRADIERRVGGLIYLRMLIEAAEYFVAGTSEVLNSTAWSRTCFKTKKRINDRWRLRSFRTRTHLTVRQVKSKLVHLMSMRLSSGLSLSASAARFTNCRTSPTSANNPA